VSAYTEEERAQAAAQFGPAGPKYSNTDLGPLDRVAAFNEVRELVAWSVLSDPAVIFSFHGQAARRLQGSLATFFTNIDALQEALGDAANEEVPVVERASLNTALLHARELQRSMEGGGGNASAHTTLVAHLDDFLDDELGKSVKASGAVKTPAGEAKLKVQLYMEALSDAYPNILASALRLPDVITDYNSVDLRGVAGSTPASKIVTRLEDIQRSPGARPRAETLELLSAISHVDAAMTPLDPGVPIASTGLAAGSGTSAAMAGVAAGAPFNIVPATNDSLTLEINDAGLLTHTLPPSTRATISSTPHVNAVDITVASTASIVTTGFVPDTLAMGGDPAVNPPWELLTTLVRKAVIVAEVAGTGNMVRLDPGQATDIVPGEYIVQGVNVARVLVQVSSIWVRVVIQAGAIAVGGANVFYNQRVQLTIDGIQTAITFDPTLDTQDIQLDAEPQFQADIGTGAPIPTALVAFEGAHPNRQIRITSRSGKAQGDTSIAIGVNQLNALPILPPAPAGFVGLGFTDNQKIRGAVGNNYLTLEADGALVHNTATTPHTPLDITNGLGSGSYAMTALRDRLNGIGVFNALAIADESGDQLNLRTLTYGRTGTMKALPTQVGPHNFATGAQNITVAFNSDGALTATDLTVPGPPNVTWITSGAVKGHFLRLSAGGTNYDLRILQMVSQVQVVVERGVTNSIPTGVYTDPWFLLPGLESTCIEVLSLPADTLEIGEDVTISQIQDTLEVSAGFTGVATDRAIEERIVVDDLVVTTAGAMSTATTLTGVLTGDTFQLMGGPGGAYAVTSAPPHAVLTFAPALRPDQLPLVATTVQARFYFDPFTLRSTVVNTTSGLRTTTGNANAILGLVDNTEIRGTVDSWADAATPVLDTLRLRGSLADTLVIDSPAVTDEILSIATNGELELLDEIQNDIASTYSLSSAGLLEFNTVAETNLSPIPLWISDTLTSVEGFQTNLSLLQNAVDALLSGGKEPERRRALALVTSLETTWAALQTILTGYNQADLPLAGHILKAVEGTGLDRGVRLLREARFSEFFAMTAETATQGGEVLVGIRDLSQDYPVLGVEGILEAARSSGHRASIEDPNLVFDEEGLANPVGFVVEDSSEAY
jgi:hypothetical protein